MFSSSVRRAVLTAPPLPIILPVHNVAPRAATSQALSFRSHQRRLSSSSSSKPSSPADGSKGVTEGQAVPASPSQARPDGEKKAAKAGRRKAKDASPGSANKADTMHNLPSVPSTSHIAPNREFSQLQTYTGNVLTYIFQKLPHPHSSPYTDLYPSL